MFKEPKTWEEALTQAVVAARVYEKIGGRLQFLRWCRAADYVVNFILAGAPVARLDRLRALANRCRNHQPRDVAWASLCSLDPDHIAELKALEAEYPHLGVTNAEVGGISVTLDRAMETAVAAHNGLGELHVRVDKLIERVLELERKLNAAAGSIADIIGGIVIERIKRELPRG